MADHLNPRSARRTRIPAFHLVPTRARVDGWTPLRQAEFIGCSAEPRPVVGAARKVTPGLQWEHALPGKAKPIMRSGTFRTVTKKPDNSRVLQHLAQLDRACRRIDAEHAARRKSQK
ncbi:hypothetical protein QWY75_13420 [Pontixanthobacter aestiaquae]|uniref:Uncharacterized protein n=1 Tax=Pontixanthobacter aestiaquae TaxID=1509367 RepID=A0A844Z2C4_9SPHN|nr:hypothetical protein [Pontixanthobacter aestiaquae]MDN3647207.1 hypothetical protein [Pontixanthobacter aestiaquae]MXO81818.1 hypothetical protein [Pontixanthobacter aestiaquae]